MQFEGSALDTRVTGWTCKLYSMESEFLVLWYNHLGLKGLDKVLEGWFLLEMGELALVCQGMVGYFLGFSHIIGLTS